MRTIRYTQENIGDFHDEVSKGRVENHFYYMKWGKNNLTTKDVPEMIINQGGFYNWRYTQELVSFVSDSAEDDDTPGGTGWRKIHIQGLDENYNLIEDIISLDGLTPVNTNLEFMFIRRVQATQEGTLVGSAGVNVGTITATGVTTADTYCVISPGVGSTQLCADIVPAGQSLYVHQIVITTRKTQVGSDPQVGVKLFIQSPEGSKRQFFEEFILDSSANGTLELLPSFSHRIPEKTRWWFEAVSDTNLADISGTVNGFRAVDQ